MKLRRKLGQFAFIVLLQLCVSCECKTAKNSFKIDNFTGMELSEIVFTYKESGNLVILPVEKPLISGDHLTLTMTGERAYMSFVIAGTRYWLVNPIRDNNKLLLNTRFTDGEQVLQFKDVVYATNKKLE